MVPIFQKWKLRPRELNSPSRKELYVAELGPRPQSDDSTPPGPYPVFTVRLGEAKAGPRTLAATLTQLFSSTPTT